MAASRSKFKNTAANGQLIIIPRLLFNVKFAPAVCKICAWCHQISRFECIQSPQSVILSACWLLWCETQHLEILKVTIFRHASAAAPPVRLLVHRTTILVRYDDSLEKRLYFFHSFSYCMYLVKGYRISRQMELSH